MRIKKDVNGDFPKLGKTCMSPEVFQEICDLSESCKIQLQNIVLILESSPKNIIIYTDVMNYNWCSNLEAVKLFNLETVRQYMIFFLYD